MNLALLYMETRKHNFEVGFRQMCEHNEELQAENERLKAIAATVKTWVDEMEDYDANDYGLTPEEKSVMRAYQRVLALFSEAETK